MILTVLAWWAILAFLVLDLILARTVLDLVRYSDKIHEREQRASARRHKLDTLGKGDRT